MSHYFRVGLTSAFDALFPQLLLEGSIVLDDPVMDYRELAVPAQMRVGVDVRGRTVGSPAGMSDPGQSRQSAASVDFFIEIPNFPAGLLHPETSLPQHRHAGGIISPVFQFPQTVQKNRRSFRMPGITNYSAHR